MLPLIPEVEPLRDRTRRYIYAAPILRLARWLTDDEWSEPFDPEARSFHCPVCQRDAHGKLRAGPAAYVLSDLTWACVSCKVTRTYGHLARMVDDDPVANERIAGWLSGAT